jgi:uncharacterized protein YyaL (SSP411 family)
MANKIYDVEGSFLTVDPDPCNYLSTKPTNPICFERKNSFFMNYLIYLWVIAFATGNERIEWHTWEAESFEKAKSQNKMILVDVGMEGCTACRWMDEITYADEKVIRLINEHFIAIQVDSEARPDIGERYSDWAWPATIFMLPDGEQVAALAGYKRPPAFIPILEDLIEKFTNGTLTLDEDKPYAAPEIVNTSDMKIIRDRLRAQVDDSFDFENGGWGRRNGLYHASNLEHLFLRAHRYNQVEIEKATLKTLDGLSIMLDPVWGGLYVASFGAWSNVIPEKRTGNQAAALFAFAEGYHLTGEIKYLDAADNIILYMDNFMTASNGTFFTSQEDDAPGLPEGMDARDYYALTSDSERRAFGIPPIDHTVYTDLNGKMIRSYSRLYEATLNPEYLKKAERAATSLLSERWQNDGWMLHTSENDHLLKDRRMRDLHIEKDLQLRPQAYFGEALLDLYKVTGNSEYLDKADQIASTLLKRLQDPDLGGFYSSEPDGTEHISPPRKALEDNGAAARFLFKLYAYSKNDRYKVAAEKSVRAVSDSVMLDREGRIVTNLLMAVEWISADYMEYCIVASEKTPQAQNLYVASLKSYNPRKILHYEKPGRYPDKGQALLYICTPDRCSPPLSNNDKIDFYVNEFK